MFKAMERCNAMQCNAMHCNGAVQSNVKRLQGIEIAKVPFASVAAAAAVRSCASRPIYQMLIPSSPLLNVFE